MSEMRDMYTVEKVGWSAKCKDCGFLVFAPEKRGTEIHMRDHLRAAHLRWTPRVLAFMENSIQERWKEKKEKSPRWEANPIRPHRVTDCWCRVQTAPDNWDSPVEINV